jgi:hypothetical protein
MMWVWSQSIGRTDGDKPYMIIGRLFVIALSLPLFASPPRVGLMIAWTAFSAGSFVAMVLVVAGVAKLGYRREFSRTVQNYKVVSPQTARVIETVLPELEVIVGCLLLVRFGVVFAGTVACALFVSFAIAVGMNLARGRQRFACGCFGPSEDRPLGWSHVVQNVILAIVTLLSAYYTWLVHPGPALWRDQLAATLAAAVILVSWWLVTLSLRFLRSAL